MLTTRTRLPFTIENVYGGFVKVNGILRVEQDILILEFQMKDNLLGGVLKGKPKVVTIPLTNVESVEFKKNWFFANMYINVYRLEDISELPNNDNGAVKLKIRRKARERAKQIESRLGLRISELKLDPHERGEGFI